MKTINLKENINMSESCNSSLKGRVTIEDKNGKIILRKNNLIVENGKEFLADLLYSQLSNDVESATETTNEETQDSETSKDITLSGNSLIMSEGGLFLNAEKKLIFSFAEGKTNEAKSDDTFLSNSENFCITELKKSKILENGKLKGIRLSGDFSNIAEESILRINENDINYKMISHLTFEKIIIPANCEFTLFYELFF